MFKCKCCTGGEVSRKTLKCSNCGVVYTEIPKNKSNFGRKMNASERKREIRNLKTELGYFMDESGSYSLIRKEYEKSRRK